MRLGKGLLRRPDRKFVALGSLLRDRLAKVCECDKKGLLAREEKGYLPIYEYECNDCRKIFEEFVKMNHQGRAVCPHCGSPARRVFVSPSNVNMSGWKGMQELMRKDAMGEIDIPEKDYPYDYEKNKGRF